MKGSLKALKRLPQQSLSRVGMAGKSNDAEFDELSRNFAILEEHAGKLNKDAKSFRDSVQTMLASSTAFAAALNTVFSPIGSEADLESRYPDAVTTIRNISVYEGDMSELKTMIEPELQLIDSRVLEPVKEFQELVKKVRKAITKREHKLVDYDRHNNSYTKLKDKKEKSLKDEQNLFKLEQDFEAAAAEYNYHNDLLKNELPQFIERTQAFMTPLQHSFYFMQLGILYNMMEKIQAFAKDKYDLSSRDIEGIHAARSGDAPERLEGLTITKRLAPTAKILADRRATGGSTSGSVMGRTSSMGSYSSGSYKAGSAHAAAAAAPIPGSTSAAAAANDIAPPPYTPPSSGSGSGSPASGKRAPPPPPAPRQSVSEKKNMVTAIWDYTAQADGDLTFKAGDRIEVVEETASANDWWTGIGPDGSKGIFPGNYVQK